jgi:hypothetical protein
MPSDVFNLHQDPLVENLQARPGDAANLRVLQGFLGESGSPGVWRLYLTSDLSSFVDVPSEDIVYATQLDPQRFPVGGTSLWVRNDTPIPAPAPPSAGADPNQFLRGLLAQRLLAAGSTPTAGPGSIINPGSAQPDLLLITISLYLRCIPFFPYP